MATLKLPEVNEDHRTSYYCVRLWKRDLVDLVETLIGAGCKLKIEDESHLYNDIEDYINNAPVQIKSIEISGRIDDYSFIGDTGVGFR